LPKLNDLSGQKFGKLTAIRIIGRSEGGKVLWHCQCECGRTKTVPSGYLTIGDTTTCGECTHDLRGLRFGKLVVVEPAPSAKGRRRWKCACDCGGEKTTFASYLKDGGVTSCGCWTRMKDMTNQKFGRLTVIEFSHFNNQGRALWHCECECGEKPIVVGGDLRSRHTRSCGCLLNEITAAGTNTTHGLSKVEPRLYGIWNGMKSRCFRETDEAYKNYGARGITVCSEWANDFKAFYDWSMNNGYEDDLSIDRIDVDGDYEPNNCRWATLEKQSRNRRSNHFVEINGETKTLTEWAELSGVSCSAIRVRIKRGWSGEQLLTPVKETKRNIRIKEHNNTIEIVNKLAEQLSKILPTVTITNDVCTKLDDLLSLVGRKMEEI
jgi:hypothetical protein